MEFIVAAYAITVVTLIGYARSVSRRAEQESRGR